MRGVYIAIISIAVVTMIMVTLAFLYLDWQQHQTFLYALYQGGVLSGYEKIDIYLLENRRLYKSFTELPRDILNRKISRRILFGLREKNFIDYKKDILSNGTKSTAYLLNTADRVSFMATGHADFSYLDKVPSHGNDLPFEIDAVVTYPLLIKRYNFKKRGEQFVNTLIPVSAFLPPVSETSSIISTGKDVIEIEDRKINCERLIFKLGSGDFISVWINQILHNVIMVEAPKHDFKAVLCTDKPVIPAQEYKRKSELYADKKIAFPNEDIMLHGVFSVPSTGAAPFPAVMLIWDRGPMDRNSLGIFSDIAHALAEMGFCVLRFDKRGAGQSHGYFLAYDQSEEIADLKCALNFLKSQPEVDRSRIAVFGYSEGAFYAARLAGFDNDVKACIIMSAPSSLDILKNDCGNIKRIIESVVPNNAEYAENAISSIVQGRAMIKNKSDWVTVLGQRVFTKKINMESKYGILNTIKNVKVPVLILHGGKDNINSSEEAKELGDTLAKSGNDNFTIIYFGELDHFFGKVVRRPPVRDHIEVDPEVLKSMTGWLEGNILHAPLELPAALPAEGIEVGEGAGVEGGPAMDVMGINPSETTMTEQSEEKKENP